MFFKVFNRKSHRKVRFPHPVNNRRLSGSYILRARASAVVGDVSAWQARQGTADAGQKWTPMGGDPFLVMCAQI